MSKRTYAADSFDEIIANRERIRQEAEQKCPANPIRSLHDCLHSSARCGESCPHFADWIGPAPEEHKATGSAYTGWGGF